MSTTAKQPSWIVRHRIALGISAVVTCCAAPLLVIVVAWSQNQVVEINPPTREILTSQPDHNFSSLAWGGPDWLAIEIHDTTSLVGGAYASELGILDLTNGTITPLVFPYDARCEPRRQGHADPQRLPDGRVGFFLLCGPPLIARSSDFMMAYDRATGKTEQLLEYELHSLGTGGFAWNPEMTQGITGDGRGRWLSERLIWLNSSGFEYVNTGFAQSFSPAWSPDGSRIVFAAAKNKGSVGQVSNYSIYMMTPDKPEEARIMFSGFNDVIGMSWSPDGRWIIFAADSPGRIGSNNGIWLIEVATNELSLLSETKSNTQNFRLATWSPDGQQIAYIWEDYREVLNLHDDITRIYLMDLSEVVNK